MKSFYNSKYNLYGFPKMLFQVRTAMSAQKIFKQCWNHYSAVVSVFIAFIMFKSFKKL